MVTEHTRRRVTRMQSYPAYAGRTNEEMIAVCEDALSVFLDLTHRSQDPGEPLDSLICDIAKNLLAHAGTEGVKKAKDGEMEREWSEQNGGIDMVLMNRIKKYRQVVGVNATPLV